LKVSHFFVQDEDSAKHLLENGINQVTVAGDSRIDHVISLTDKSRQIPRLESLKKQNSRVFVYGSIYPEDMKVIQPFISEHSEDIHILVPHNVSDENINKILFKLDRPASKYSDESTLVSPVIIDTIGILNQIYQLADCVYIGGGFNHGIHNTLEPAVYGIPVLFGPKYQKFPEAVEFIKLGLAKCVRTNQEFSSGIQLLLNNKEEVKSKSEEFFNKYKGASSKVLNTMYKLGLCQN
jgi:3-deoxy-D-manno-octulosonic-acid transferase